jgi:hypothetical protein
MDHNLRLGARRALVVLEAVGGPLTVVTSVRIEEAVAEAPL